jgi:hypothetical protein
VSGWVDRWRWGGLFFCHCHQRVHFLVGLEATKHDFKNDTYGIKNKINECVIFIIPLLILLYFFKLHRIEL